MSKRDRKEGRPVGPPSSVPVPFDQPSGENLLMNKEARLARHSLDLKVVRDLGKALFNRKDPFNPADVAELATRRLPSFYAPDFIKEVDSTLVRVLTSGGRLFVRGKAHGVGVTTLLTDLARAFNFRAAKAGYDERVKYVQLQGITTSKQMVSFLCRQVGCTVTNSDRRLHSLDDLMQRFVVSAANRNISTIIIDHAHNAKGEAREALRALMCVTDPSTHVPLEISEYDELIPQIGVVLASHRSPSQLFKEDRSAVHALASGGEIVVEPFADRHSLAGALRQADIGLDDLQLSDPMDHLMVEWILAVTGGRLSLITPLLQLVDVVGRAYGNVRPNMAFLHAALPFQRSIREKALVWKEPRLPEERPTSWPEPPRFYSNREQKKTRSAKPKDRSASLKEQRKHRDAARKERNKINRSRSHNLPGM